MNISKLRYFNYFELLKNRNLFHTSVVLVLMFWVIESLLHLYVFEHSGDTHGFFEAFFPDDSNELWMRIFISVLLLILGYFSHVAMRRIRITHELNREILDNSTNAYLAINKNWTIGYMNIVAQQLLNINRDRDLGKLLSDVLPDLASTFYKPLRQSMNEGKTIDVSGFYSLTDKSLKLHVFPTTTGISLSIQDVSREMYYQEQTQRYRVMIDNSLDGIISINRLGIVQTYSKSAESIFGYKCHEVIGKNISMLMPENHARHHDAYISRYLRTGNAKLVGIGAYEVQALHQDGSIFDMDLAVNEAVINDEVMFIANVRDISQRKGLQRKLEYLSNYDSLTGLPNRTLLIDSLKQAIKMAIRHNGKLAILFLDLNGFKQINDTYGHDVGDKLLVAVGKLLQGCLRKSDMVARLGGDEFVIILEDIKHPDDAEYVAKKIIEKFKATFYLNGDEIDSGTSIGIALFPDDGYSYLELLKHSDAAMYVAKRSEGSCFHVYSKG